MEGADTGGDDWSPPGGSETMKVSIELKAPHGDNYSTKDLLVDTSIFKSSDRELFKKVVADIQKKKAHPTQLATRGRQHPNWRHMRGVRNSSSVKQQPAADEKQSHPWITGYKYYFIVKPDSNPPFIVQGHTSVPPTGWPPQIKDRVSFHERLATAKGITSGTQIQIAPLPKTMWEEYETEHAEISVINTFLSRSDLWGAVQLLRYSSLYVGKKVLISGNATGSGISASVKALSGSSKQPTFSGIIAPGTKFTVRSLSARIMLLFQISSEMFTYSTDSEGDIYINRAIDVLLDDIVQKWKNASCQHAVSIILFAKTRGTVDEVRDYIRPVWHSQNLCEDWTRVPHILKTAVNTMIRDMRVTTLIHPATHLGSEGNKLCNARTGNTLEVINLALNSLTRHHIDRSLTRTGQAIIIITAGTGLLHTTRELSRLTAQRILDTGTGCDAICLGPPPLHLSPLLEFEAHTSNSPYVYESPTWMGTRYYCKRPTATCRSEFELLGYAAALRVFENEKKTTKFQPQCRMNSATVEQIRSRWEQVESDKGSVAVDALLVGELLQRHQQGGIKQQSQRDKQNPTGDRQLTMSDKDLLSQSGSLINPSVRGVSFIDNLPATEGSQPLQSNGNISPPSPSHQSAASVVTDSFPTSHSGFGRHLSLGRSTTLSSPHLDSLLPDNYEELDKSAFQFSTEPIKWMAEARQTPLSSSGMNSLSVNTSIALSRDCKERDSLLRGSPRSRPAVGMKASHTRVSSVISEEIDRLDRLSSLGGGDVRKASGLWSPQRGPSQSPTKVIEEIQKRSKSASVGPQPLLTSPFCCDNISQTAPSITTSVGINVNVDPFEEANRNRWSHLFPPEASFATGMSTEDSHMWKFIIEPALLPLTSPYYPVRDTDSMIQGFEIHHSQKTPSSKGMVPLPHGLPGVNTFLHEAIVQRLHQGYQYIPPYGGDLYRLSIGHQFHEVYLNANLQYCFQQWIHQEYRSRQQPASQVLKQGFTPPSPVSSMLDVKLSTSQPLQSGCSRKLSLDESMSRGDDDSSCIAFPSGNSECLLFCYHLHNPFSRGWDFQKIQFHNESGNVYVNWSALDQLLSGAQESDIDRKQSLIDPLFNPRKVKFAIIPPQATKSPETFKEGVTRWLDQVCSGSDFLLQKKEQLSKVVIDDSGSCVTTDLKPFEEGDLKTGKVLEFVLENHDARQSKPPLPADYDESSYQYEVITPSTAIANVSVQAEGICRSCWILFSIDSHLHPECYVTFTVTWLACPSYKITDFVDLCRRRMLQTLGQGCTLVQIPCDTGDDITSSGGSPRVAYGVSPLTPNTWIGVPSARMLGLILLNLIENHGYVPSTNTLTYGSVLIHVSGEVLLHVPRYVITDEEDGEQGMYFIANNLVVTSSQFADTSQYDQLLNIVETWTLAYEVMFDIIARCENIVNNQSTTLNESSLKEIDDPIEVESHGSPDSDLMTPHSTDC